MRRPKRILVNTDRVVDKLEGAESDIQAAFKALSPRPAAGAAVAVRYLPQNPQMAFIVSFLHMWAAPLAMFVLGIAALVGYLKN